MAEEESFDPEELGRLNVSLSVSTIAEDLWYEKSVSSWEIVRSILQRHTEYGESMGEKFVKESGPSDVMSMP